MYVNVALAKLWGAAARGKKNTKQINVYVIGLVVNNVSYLMMLCPVSH